MVPQTLLAGPLGSVAVRRTRCAEFDRSAGRAEIANMSIIPIPNNRWTKTDKIAYLSLVVSVAALVFSFTISIFGYRSQSRYNELQNALLLTQNYPELKYKGFKLVTWLQDDQPFMSVTLKNTGKIGAMGLKVEGGFAGDRREYTHSHQSGFYDPRFTLLPEQELLCPLASQQDLEQENNYSDWLLLCMPIILTYMLTQYRTREWVVKMACIAI